IGAGVQAGGQDDDLTDARRGGVGEVGVEEVRAHGLVAAHVLDDRGDLVIGVAYLRDELAVEHELPDAGPRSCDQVLGVRVADQWIVTVGLGSPGRGNHDRGRANAAGDVPGVVLRALRAHRASPSSRACTNTLSIANSTRSSMAGRPISSALDMASTRQRSLKSVI